MTALMASSAIAFAVLAAVMTVAEAEPIDEDRAVHDPLPLLAVESAIAARSDGTTSLGTGISVRSGAGPVTFGLGLTRWEELRQLDSPKDGGRWQATGRLSCRLVTAGRLHGYGLAVASVEAWDGGGLAVSGELGLGASVAITEWLTAFAEVSMRRRAWLQLAAAGTRSDGLELHTRVGVEIMKPRRSGGGRLRPSS